MHTVAIRKEIVMPKTIDYNQSEHIAYMGNKEFTVRSLTPKMTEEQRSEAKKKIQCELYSVFCKYMT